MYELPEWVTRFLAFAESWTVIASMALFMLVPIVLLGGLVWMVRGFWRTWRSKQ